MEEVSALAAGGAAMLEEAAGMARAAAAAIFCARVCQERFFTVWAPFVLLVGLILGLVLLENDMGTAIIIAALATAMFFIAGANLPFSFSWRWVVAG